MTPTLAANAPLIHRRDRNAAGFQEPFPESPYPATPLGGDPTVSCLSFGDSHPTTISPVRHYGLVPWPSILRTLYSVPRITILPP